MRMRDLFAAADHDAVPGLVVKRGFLSDEEAAWVVCRIDAQTWTAGMRRRVQHYGYRYDYRARAIDESMRAAALPSWATRIGHRLVERGLFPALPDQLIVNEYLPGQGIAAHVDCVPCFGDVVASVSLLSACPMTFTSPDGARRVDVDMAPGSVVLLAGASRYEWRHGIAPRMSDRVDGLVRPRARRVSATFRTVIHQRGR